MSPHTNTEGKKQQKSSNIGSLTKNNTYQKFQIWYRTESEVDSYKWLLEDAFEFFLNDNFSCTISPSFRPLHVFFPTQKSLNKLVREFPFSCLVHFFKFFGFFKDVELFVTAFGLCNKWREGYFEFFWQISLQISLRTMHDGGIFVE